MEDKLFLQYCSEEGKCVGSISQTIRDSVSSSDISCAENMLRNWKEFKKQLQE